MAEVKWTPWEYIGDGGIIGCDGGGVARLVRRTNDGETDKVLGPLLAAAPEMYKALAEVVAADDVWDCNPEDDERVKRAFESARAALAKARGE